MRSTLALALLLAAWFTPSRSAAQSCHGARNPGMSGDGVGARISTVVGAYDTAGVSGDYAGLIVGAWGRSRFVEGEVAIGGYFLEDAGNALWGLGDTVFAVRGRILADPEPMELALGARLSMPSARANSGLGMGHFMAGPELRAGHAWARIELSTSLAYMRALSAADAHAHHHHNAGPTPRVDPHGRSELSWAVSFGVRVHEDWLLRAAGVLSLPIDDQMGTSRLVVGPGVTWTHERVSLSFDAETPLLGSPFIVRGTVSFGVRLL